MHVEFDKPTHGWIGLKLSEGSRELLLTASRTPYDSITELASAISKVLKGLPRAIVSWNEEPTESDFVFTGSGRSTVLQVVQFPNGIRTKDNEVRILEIHLPRLDICTAFWRALRRLQTCVSPEEYRDGWGRPFPAEKVAEISKLIRLAKSS